jgi:hypothetical protein
MACSRESVKKYVYFSRKIDMKSIPLILPLMALPISGQAEKRGNVEMPQCPNVVFIYADDSSLVSLFHLRAPNATYRQPR